jgi:hypothetical protein
MTTITRPPDLRPGWWMTLKAWLDEDGVHVWFQHDCTDGRVTNMAAHPRWEAKGGRVTPSFNCSKCGLHDFVELSDPPVGEGR